MIRTADKDLPRSFAYVSDLKLAEFLSQIDNRTRRKILADLKITVTAHLALLDVSVEKQLTDASARNRAQAVQIAVVEQYIRQQFTVGDPASGRRWIAGQANMEWAPLGDRETVLFCGYDESLLVALGGSFAHVKGRGSSSDRLGSHYRTIRSAILDGDDPANLGPDLASAARKICISPQPVRFLAEVLGHGTLPEGSPQREYVIATPLYVEAVYTQNAGVTPGRPLRPDDPEEIGGYLLRRRLGEGAMGTVYLALDTDGSKVALKIIRAEHADNPAFLLRFQGEADNARRVQAPNVARVITSGTDAGRPYLVTEFVDGPTLEKLVDEHGPLKSREAIDVCTGVAAALDAIHNAGIVHRDLTPSNVILSGSGPKVVDFGIARAMDTDEHVTQLGRPVGTPPYMSPEQINQGKLTPASDIFSWGGIAVFALTGHQPFGTRNMPSAALWQDIRYGRTNLAGVPRPLRGTLAAALSRDPAQRPTAAWLRRQLPRAARAWRDNMLARVAVGAGAGIYAAIALFVLVTGTGPKPGPVVTPWPAARPGLVATSGTLAATLNVPGGLQVVAVAFSPYEETIGATGSGANSVNGHVYLWDTAYPRQGPRAITAPNGGGGALGIAFSPTGNDLAVGDLNGVDLWNLATGHVQTITDPDAGHPGVVTNPDTSDNSSAVVVTYTPNGNSVVEGNARGDVYELNVASERWSPIIFKDPGGENSALEQIVMSPDGAALAIADVSKTDSPRLYLMNMSGRPAAVDLDNRINLTGQGSDTMAFSPNGHTLAVPDPGGTTLWDVASRKPRAHLAGTDTSPQAEAFTPNGTTLATGDYNGNIYLWDLATRRFKVIHTTVHAQSKSFGGLAGLVFSPDGKTLAAYALNGKIYLYRISYERP